MKKVALFLLTATALLGLAACGSTKTESQSPATSSPDAMASSPDAMASSPAAMSSPDAMSASPGSSTSATTKLDVAESEMKIQLSSATVPAGPIDFVVHNDGKVPHELVIFKTDLPLNQLPTKSGKLDEESAQLKNIVDTGEQELKGGESKTLQATLAPGHYVAICNVRHHFMEGMKTEFTVQ
jgi:uncharacterized cupredoxin-like copper-binding protein